MHGVNANWFDQIANLFNNTLYSTGSYSIGSNNRTNYTLQEDKKAILDLNISSIFTTAYYGGTNGNFINSQTYSVSTSAINSIDSNNAIWISNINEYTDNDGGTSYVEILYEG